MYTKVILRTWKADYLVLLQINGQRKKRLNTSTLANSYNWRHIIKYNLAHMFQLCMSKHSCALGGLHAIAGSSVNFWGQRHLCNKGKWSPSLNHSNLYIIRRNIMFNLSPKEGTQLVWKGAQLSFASWGNCTVQGSRSILCGKWTAEGCEPNHSHQAAWPTESCSRDPAGKRCAMHFSALCPAVLPAAYCVTVRQSDLLKIAINWPTNYSILV